MWNNKELERQDLWRNLNLIRENNALDIFLSLKYHLRINYQNCVCDQLMKFIPDGKQQGNNHEEDEKSLLYSFKLTCAIRNIMRISNYSIFKNRSNKSITIVTLNGRLEP